MSSSPHSTITSSAFDMENAFSTMNIYNSTSASSGSTSFNSPEDSRDGMIPPTSSLFYNNPYLKGVQAFYANESPIPPPDPITPPVILTLSPILPPSLLFIPRYFFVPRELLPPKKQIHSPSSSLTMQINDKKIPEEIFPVFVITALKNDLKKLKGSSVDTNFAKTSVLGKPVLSSLRNQSVVRQPNAFKSERPQMSKPRFASQVDVNNNLSRPVTQHYLPKSKESILAKPDHMIASSESRNSSKNMLRFSSNDMVHNHYLDEAKKKTQERDRNSKTSVTPSARLQSTADGSKPKPRSNNQTPRSLLVSKSSCVTITTVPKADHSKSSSSFSDSKQFVCSTCHKCVFSAKYDACIIKLLKEVHSRAKIQSYNTKNSNKPIDQKGHTQKPHRQIFTRHRWIPTGKLFESCTSKVDSEPPHGSNVDIPNIHECKQTLDVSADMIVMTSMIELESLFGPSFNEYFNGENQIVSKSFVVTAADASVKRQQQPNSTSSTSTLATTVTADGNFVV
ncbi:hypothetical protein Tco_0109273 [Tanacetum coccineum]